jgi:hypothetical protein
MKSAIALDADFALASRGHRVRDAGGGGCRRAGRAEAVIELPRRRLEIRRWSPGTKGDGWRPVRVEPPRPSTARALHARADFTPASGTTWPRTRPSGTDLNLSGGGRQSLACTCSGQAEPASPRSKHSCCCPSQSRPGMAEAQMTAGRLPTPG